MSSLGHVDRDQIDPILRNEIESERGWVPRLFRVMGFSAPVLASWVGLANTFRAETTLSRRERELVILLVASVTRSEYEWGHHSVAALPDVSADEVEALASWPSGGTWSIEDESVLRLAAAVIAGEAHPVDHVETLVTLRGRRFVVEVTALAAYYVAVGRFACALEIQPDPSP